MPENKKLPKRQKKIKSEFHVDDRILYDHLRDVRAEMSWRRDLEFRLVQILLILYPVIGTVMVQIFKENIVDSRAFGLTAVLIAVLVVGVSSFVILRIAHEHEEYAKLGKQVQKIWLYFGLFEPGAYLRDEAFLSPDLMDEKKGLGQGQGYRRTQYLVAGLTIVMIAILYSLAYLKT